MSTLLTLENQARVLFAQLDALADEYYAERLRLQKEFLDAHPKSAKTMEEAMAEVEAVRAVHPPTAGIHGFARGMDLADALLEHYERTLRGMYRRK